MGEMCDGYVHFWPVTSCRCKVVTLGMLGGHSNSLILDSECPSSASDLA